MQKIKVCLFVFVQKNKQECLESWFHSYIPFPLSPIMLACISLLTSLNQSYYLSFKQCFIIWEWTNHLGCKMWPWVSQNANKYSHCKVQHTNPISIYVIAIWWQLEFFFMTYRHTLKETWVGCIYRLGQLPQWYHGWGTKDILSEKKELMFLTHKIKEIVVFATLSWKKLHQATIISVSHFCFFVFVSPKDHTISLGYQLPSERPFVFFHDCYLYINESQ